MMKKTFLGLFASLMVAGVLSAASGLTTTYPAAEEIVMIGDGTSPILVSAIPADDACDDSSHNK